MVLYPNKAVISLLLNPRFSPNFSFISFMSQSASGKEVLIFVFEISSLLPILNILLKI